MTAAVASPLLDKVRPGEARYRDLAARTAYGRARGEPDVFYVARSAEEAAVALGDAVVAGLRVAPRSGGQCHENFVADEAVRAVIDTSLMTRIDWDPEFGAFAVDCGVTLGELYRTLFLGWGAMLPAGIAPAIGVGGYLPGGGFGVFARQHGLAADHLYAVEVATVGSDGAVRLVRATREGSDPNRELWWAHTGGGGGNFGLATRFWLRSPGAERRPRAALPPAPTRVLRFRARWAWDSLDPARFARLVRNHGDWCEANAAPGCPAAQLYATLALPRREAGEVTIRGICVAAVGAEAMAADYLAAIDAGVGCASPLETEDLSWLAYIREPLPGMAQLPGRPRRLGKVKDAFLKRGPSEAQIATAWAHLTDPADSPIAGGLSLGTYGGAVNAAAPDATASAQRGSVITLSLSASWRDLDREARSLTWLRAFYADFFRASGGVPAPGADADGAFINHPDRDLADPRWNRSGVPWSRLYYKENYPRLQAAKARWDPLNVFRHALSVEPPATG